MKRLLPMIPIVLFLALSACVDAAVRVENGVIQTLTALEWTPTITPIPTNVPNSQQIVYLLNIEPAKDLFMTRLAQLEHTIGAEYQVLEVEFPVKDGVTTFQVDVRCTCGSKANCCKVEPMFVFTMQKMHAYREEIISMVPTSVTKLTVKCYDHTDPFALMSADWQDVKSFLRGDIDGRRFGFRVKRE